VADDAGADPHRGSDFGLLQALLTQCPGPRGVSLGRAFAASLIDTLLFGHRDASRLVLAYLRALDFGHAESTLATVRLTGPLKSICSVTETTRNPFSHQSASRLMPSRMSREMRSSFQKTSVSTSP
jgi:hypothetical protein